jgi:hypothetical protein
MRGWRSETYAAMKPDAPVTRTRDPGLIAGMMGWVSMGITASRCGRFSRGSWNGAEGRCLAAIGRQGGSQVARWRKGGGRGPMVEAAR